MLQALVELVGAVLHGIGSTPSRTRRGRAATGDEQRTNLVIAIVVCVVLGVCIVGLVVGVVLALADA